MTGAVLLLLCVILSMQICLIHCVRSLLKMSNQAVAHALGDLNAKDSGRFCRLKQESQYR